MLILIYIEEYILERNISGDKLFYTFFLLNLVMENQDGGKSFFRYFDEDRHNLQLEISLFLQWFSKVAFLDME